MEESTYEGQICAYCGIAPANTIEHVIPKSVFATQPRYNVRIPVCRECNAEKAKDDDYLRDILAIEEACQYHPEARALLPKVYESTAHGTSAFAVAVVHESEEKPYFTRDGIYLGNKIAVSLDEARIKRIFSWIARGLYYHIHNRRLLDECVVEGTRVPNEMAPWVWQQIEEKLGIEPTIYGSGVFGFVHAYDSMDLQTNYWIMGFFQWLPITNLEPVKRGNRKKYIKGFLVQHHLGLTYYLKTNSSP